MNARWVVLVVAVAALVLACEATYKRSWLQGTLNGMPRRTVGSDSFATGSQVGFKWFEDQLLDHFDDTDASTWRQRYLVNTTLWTKSGPIFLMLQGEAPIFSTDLMGGGSMQTFAANYGAAMFELEHRFYGASQPFNKTSDANLRYLNSDQALADVARFIGYVNENYVTNGVPRKWIVFGGSYAGALTAWMRLKYPHLVLGAISSSGPVNAELDFYQYFITVAQAFGPQCNATFANATQQIEIMLQTAQGRAQLEKTFNLCMPIITENDQVNFLNDLAGEVSGVVQYNNEGGTTTAQVCQVMTDPTYTSPVEAYAAVMHMLLGNDCWSSSYDAMIAELSVDLVDPSIIGGRAWFWQTCTEFGYYQTGDSPLQPFSPRINLQYYLGICKGAFSRTAPNVNNTNNDYGATDVQGTNIFFTNGSLDPWHNLGVYQGAPDLWEQYFFIPGTAHCQDMMPPTPNDPPALTQCRQAQNAAIGQWLEQSQ